MLSTAKPALDSLDLMEKSANYKSLFLNVQQFGSRLHSFLEMAAFRCADIKGGKEKCQIIARLADKNRLLISYAIVAEKKMFSNYLRMKPLSLVELQPEIWI